jgi:Uma2 family endonuclease
MASARPATPRELLPNHNDLPDTDGSIVENAQETPQGRMLSSAIEPLLRQRHPDGRYFVGQDVGIYFRWTNPPLEGCKSPDWFYVPNVSPLWKGEVRRSFVLWHESALPLVVLEYVSGNGSEERDRTPQKGKMWIYENKIKARYYGIYEVDPGRVELYERIKGKYRPVPANERGHFPIPPLAVELGIWQGEYLQYDLPWLRWWDAQGNLLPTVEEREELERQRAEQERQRAEQEKQRAEQEKRRAEKEKRRAEKEKQRAERLAEKLRELGVDPDTL